jgi:hypothetical protein
MFSLGQESLLGQPLGKVLDLFPHLGLGGHDEFDDGLANGLSSRIAKHPFRGWIPASDTAVHIPFDHSQRRLMEVKGPPLCLGQGLWFRAGGLTHGEPW